MSARPFTPAILALSFLATPVRAQAPPVPGNCAFPSHINLVAQGYPAINDPGAKDPVGTFTVTLRGALNQPIPGWPVYVDLTGCTMSFASSRELGPGGGNCTGVVVATTDANGVATFDITGATLHRLVSEPNPCGSIWTDGAAPPKDLKLGNVSVATYDEDGVSGLNAADLRLWYCDFLRGFDANVRQRSDFDGNGSLTALDAVAWAQAYFGGASPRSAARCDGKDTRPQVTLTDGKLYLAGMLGGRGACQPAGGGVGVDCILATTPTRFIASFASSVSIPAPIAYEADLDLVGPQGQPLPPFWQFQPGGCNEGALTGRLTSYYGTQGPTGCPVAFANGSAQWLQIYDVAWPYPGTGAVDRAHIRLVGSPPPVSSPPMTSGTQYIVFGLDLDPTNAGACGGCMTSIALKLNTIRIVQGNPSCDAPNGPLASLSSVLADTSDIVIAASSSDSSSVVFLNGVPDGYQITGVGGDGGTGEAWLAAPEPNPSAGGRRLRYRTSREGEVNLGVYDVSGRRVRQLVRGREAAGVHQVGWDGRAEDGSAAPGGVYFLRLVTAEGTFRRSLITIR